MTDEIKRIQQTAKTAEKELNAIFETQDRIADDINRLKTRLTVLENKNKTHVQTKKALKLFSKKEAPQPVITAAKTIIQGTIIKAPHSSIVLSEDKSRVKIQELGTNENGINLFEMTFSEL